MPPKAHINLRAISPKTQWGFRPLRGMNSIVTLSDNEYVIAVGSKMVLLDDRLPKQKMILIDNRMNDVICVSAMVVSLDEKYIGAMVRMMNDEHTANLLVYDASSRFQSSVKPRHIQYSYTGFMDGGGSIEFTSIAFSHDSHYIACGTNVPTVGVLIYEHASGCIFQKIVTESSTLKVSFNPLDASKVCTTGHGSMFKFWRFTGKSVHAAPVVGLKTGNFAYSCHAWVSAADNIVVAGSTRGFLVMVQGCEQAGTPQHAFDLQNEHTAGNCSVCSLLVKGEVVFALSSSNCIAVFEVKKGLSSTGASKVANNLAPLARYVLGNIKQVSGLQLCTKDAMTSFKLICAAADSLYYLDIISEHDVAFGAVANGAAGEPGTARTAETELTAEAPPSRPKTPNQNDMEWIIFKGEQPVYQFHSGAVQSLSLSSRISSFVTSSFDDGSVRVWDYDKLHSFDASWVIERFHGRADEKPFHVDMHPSGLFVVFGCETEVREFAIADNQLDLVNKFTVRVPFTGPTGTPYMVSQPISIVRYSHGGHLLAVVTGKLAQIFHLYSRDYSTSNVAGNMTRMTMLTDNSALITDIAFTHDDSHVITSASDGAVYSWAVGAHAREGEFVFKGVPATRLSVGPLKTEGQLIIACFENQTENLHQAADVVRKRRQSSMMLRKLSRSNTMANLMGIGGGSSGHLSPSATRSFDLGDHGGSDDGSTGSGMMRRLAAAGQQGSSSSLMKGASKKCFLAVWRGSVSSAPTIVHLDGVVRSIAIGETDGPDKADICVLGFADGRILVANLPFALRIVSAGNAGVPTTVSISTNATINHAVLSGAGAGAGPGTGNNIANVNNARKRRKSALLSVNEVSTEYTKSSMSLQSDLDEDADTIGSGSMGGAMSPLAQQTDDARSYGNDKISVSHAPRSPSSASKSSSKVGAIVQKARMQNDIDILGDAGSDSAASKSKTLWLDTTCCVSFHLHEGAVLQVAVSANGMWIVSTGTDGAIFMLATTRRACTLTEASSEYANKYLVIDRRKLHSLRNQLLETASSVGQIKKENELRISKLLDEKSRQLFDLETKMKKEIQKREETIFQGRTEYIHLLNSKKADIAAIEKKCADAISDLELSYERKFAQDSLYLNKMKQAYDEYVVHTRMDLTAMQRKADTRIGAIESEKVKALNDAERQKGTVLQYFEFLKLRHNEVLQSMETKQVEERYEMKEEIHRLKKALEDVQKQNMADVANTTRALRKLNSEIETRDVEVMRLNSDLDWANDRIMKLEASLQQAVQDLRVRNEVSEKWEYKAGEMQQKIVDLERIRKALTSQLHALRQELGPKEERLVKASERLQEMDREYEVSLFAISEKEKTLSHKSENINLLQKQVRELRNLSGRKDAALRRAATLFDEYRYALQQAYFSSEKRTVTVVGAVGVAGSAADASRADYGGSDGAGGAVAAAATAQSSDHTARFTGRHSVVGGKRGFGGAGAAGGAGLLGSTDPSSEVVEIIAQNEGMKAAYKRLADILTPYLKEVSVDLELRADQEAVFSEQERHMSQLHRNVSGLRANLDIVNLVAANKVQNHLVDNQNLLKEVNNLRLEVRNLSMENQRLLAKLTTSAIIKSKHQRANMHDQQQQGQRDHREREREIKPRLITESFYDSASNMSFAGSDAESADPPPQSRAAEAAHSSAVVTIPSSILRQETSGERQGEEGHGEGEGEEEQARKGGRARGQAISHASLEDLGSLNSESGVRPSQEIYTPNHTDLKDSSQPSRSQQAAEEKIAALIALNEREIQGIAKGSRKQKKNWMMDSSHHRSSGGKNIKSDNSSKSSNNNGSSGRAGGRIKSSASSDLELSITSTPAIVGSSSGGGSKTVLTIPSSSSFASSLNKSRRRGAGSRSEGDGGAVATQMRAGRDGAEQLPSLTNLSKASK